ncbi:ABC-2 type transport system permease protein [Entomortierella parvispora]|uniref:ABC-2 type transport system permease protein n=1 Tax=Entomortierella parvispora TaxID=205924 RepID=A0A9P3LY82_9FUNG|nr:ABC-2 type transport system permease protein [Entomortierella parvispora]
MNASNTPPQQTSEGGNVLSGENVLAFNLSDPLPLFMVQTIIILSLCYIVNMGMHRLRQPKVVSEVLSGILLGPSVLGQIPGFSNNIFPSESIPFLTLAANLGLVLFLFLVGLELDPKLILKRAKHALGISVAGLVIPFSFSCGVSVLLYKDFEKASTTTPAPPFSEFLLTCGVAMSLTAFPVLARILAEMQLMSTTVGFITVCAAAAGDILGWIMLALLVSLINATTPIMPLYVILMAVGWVLFLVFAVRPVLLTLIRVTHSEEEPSQKMIAITLVIVLTSAYMTSIIGIHEIFGGFLVGLLIPHDSGFAEGLTRRIEDLVGVYFLPIFFACSGLKTQVNLLNNGQTWGLLIMVVTISFCGKMLGCVSAARFSGMTWREALAIGFLMNCKGLVEYIILNIGHDAGVISDRVFVILICMCVLLTMLSTPFVGYLYPVSYQKEMEVRREAERKLQLHRTPSSKAGKNNGNASGKAGFFARLRNRKGGNKKDLEAKYVDAAANTDYEDLDVVRIDSESAMDEANNHSWKSRNAIMFCLDKTPNAPGVMTMLQLFSGTMGLRRSKPYVSSAENAEDGSKQSEPRYKGILQPSIDISDPQGNRRTHSRKDEVLDYEVDFSKIYAIRLLHISERTSAALLTASRCMDRLYKDTVMMMVMAFAKLNSIPLKPLVSLSTDGQSTAAQDILDRAIDLNVGWIVFPWNSSHLVDLPTSVGPTLLSGNNNTTVGSIHEINAGTVAGGGSTHLQPGLMMSMANTGTTTNSAVSAPGTPDATTDNSRQLPYNISRYFDHDESQKIASGGHVDLSHSGQSHRTSVSSNTKTLSKLIPASAEVRISTAVMVDRGLGLFGGVEHLVVPLLGGEDDYETLCLASCLARSTSCFVTILRISSVIPTTAGFQPNMAHSAADRSVPPTPDGISSTIRQRQSFRRTMEEGMTFDPQRPRADQCPSVPVDDKTLFQMFFPNKPPFKGRPSQHQGTLNVPKLPSAGQDSDEEGALEDGVMVLKFLELSDAVQWARSCLTAQDLMVIGFDSNVIAGTVHRGASQDHSRPLSTVSDSRFFTRDDDDKSVGGTQTTSNISGRTGKSGESRSPLMVGGNTSTMSSPRSILERRGLHLSPPSILSNNNNDHPVQSPASSAPPTPNTVGFEEDGRRGRGAFRTGTAAARLQRSKSRGGRSSRSISKGRKSTGTPGGADQDGHRRHLSTSSAAYPTTTGAMTTCQVMLGYAADQMIQSGVNSSLLVVRSRWFADRIRSHQHSIGLSLGQFKLGVSLTNTSVNTTQQQQVVRQYQKQQHQHHAREHSKLSQDWTNIQLGNDIKIQPFQVPDVMVEDASEKEVMDAEHSRDASQKRELDEDDMMTPRTSEDMN